MEIIAEGVSPNHVSDNLGLDVGKSGYNCPVTKTTKENISCKIHICQHVSSMPATVLNILDILT